MTDIGEIAVLLNRRRWIPSDAELRMGTAAVERVQALGVPRNPPVPPQRDIRPSDPRSEVVPWKTQLILRAPEQAAVADAVLAEHAPTLPPDSAMVRIISAYADAARDLTALAERLAVAWQRSPAPAPSWEEVQAQAKRRHCSSEEAWGVLAEHAMFRWESEHLSPADREHYDRVVQRQLAISSTLNAALSGDVDW
jgi:hypothetical protein